MPGRSRKRVLVVIGTRPEAVKMAPVVRALRATSWAEVRVVATAQHRQMLDQVLQFFGIGVDRDLDLMRPDQPLADLASRMIAALDPVLAEERPDCVLAQGDTTTTMVAALAAFYRHVFFGHVEAGLRTGDPWSPFPEEAHRKIVAQLASVHFAPTAEARNNLQAEGVPASAVHVVGNTVVDAVQWARERVDPLPFAPAGGRRLLLVTAHRRENFGAPLAAICTALQELADRPDVELLWPVHRNPSVHDVAHRLLAGHPRIRLVAPLGYADMIAAMLACTLILTDSGGIQEEAPSLGKPVLVLRAETERPEGVLAGAAELVGTEPARILDAATRLLDDPAAWRTMATVRNPYGDGGSAPALVAALERSLTTSL